MGFEYFKGEVERAYKVLDCFSAECQNSMDMRIWLREKLISEFEYRKLVIVNKALFKEYRG